MAHWLLKSEPDDWSWTEQVAKGREGAEWTGIRNFSAQNNPVSYTHLTLPTILRV